MVSGLGSISVIDMLNVVWVEIDLIKTNHRTGDGSRLHISNDNVQAYFFSKERIISSYLKELWLLQEDKYYDQWMHQIKQHYVTQKK